MENKFWVWVLALSLLLNCYFVHRYLFVKPTVVVKDRIVEVIKVKTAWKVVATKPITRPEGSAEATLTKLEHSIPDLQLQPLYLYKDEGGNIEIPNRLGATLKLGYLEWDLMALLSSEVEYAERPLNLRLGFLGLCYYKDTPKVTADINLMVPFWGLNLGVGLRAVTLTKVFKIYNQTELDYGIGYLYNTALVGTLGCSFHL